MHPHAILITGASDGIGLASARILHGRGERPFLHGRKPLAERDPLHFDEEHYLRADLAHHGAAAEIAGALSARGATRLDRLVLNAGSRRSRASWPTPALPVTPPARPGWRPTRAASRSSSRRAAPTFSRRSLGPTHTEHARMHSPGNTRESRRMEPAELAARIVRAVEERRRVLVPDPGNRAFAPLDAWTPALTDRVLSRVILARLDAAKDSTPSSPRRR